VAQQVLWRLDVIAVSTSSMLIDSISLIHAQ